VEALFIGIVLFAVAILIGLVVFLFKPKQEGGGDKFLSIAAGQDRIEKTLRDELARGREEMSRFGAGNDRQIQALRDTLDRRLLELRADNEAKLEAIRRTVDEKLHETLDKRLNASFNTVSERLEQVQAGLGEMRTLAAGVSDLQKLLGNVKNRGTFGETQLIAIAQDMLSPNQYSLNAAVKKGSLERVELAIKLPGRAEEPVWLAVDAKFPKEDYERLIAARENGDKQAAARALAGLEQRFKLCAKEISEKYISPPETTDFALMFLASEGLFAECLGRPGLSETIQRDYKVIVTGPTTFAAVLNSLQMGFRTLAVERRSADVWQTLSVVKTEFEKFGDLLEKTRKKLQEAADTVDTADRKSRALQKQLVDVERAE
jgi:DNA recombination protein RmuC